MKYRVLLLLLLTVFLVSCGITDFEMPSWNVELNSIPLMNKNFPASDLEGENIIIEGDTLIAVIDDELVEATPELSKNITDATPDIGIQSNSTEAIRFELYSMNSGISFNIVQGKFESGEMILTFTGNKNNFNELQITFSQLINEDGSVLVKLVTPENLDANNQYTIYLAGLTLTDQDIDGDFWLIDIDVYTDSSLPNGDNVGEVKFSIDDLIVFSSFEGRLNYVRTLNTETDVEIDYPNNLENAIVLDEISMYFDVYNQIGFEFELTGDLVAYKDGVIVSALSIGSPIIEFPSTDSLDVDLIIDASPGEGVEVLTRIEIKNNDKINHMLRLMPDKVSFINPTYKVENLEDVEPGFVSNLHSIRCDYQIEVPLKATYYDDFLIYPDNVFEVNISKDNQELIAENVNHAQIQLKLINNFPIGGILDLYLSSVELEADSLALEQAELIIAGHDIEVSSEEFMVEIELTKEELMLFSRDTVFIRTRVRFHNSNGVVAIFANDNLNVKGSLNLFVKIEGE